LGVHVQTVYIWLRDGKLGCVRLSPRTVRVTEDQLAAFLAEHSVKAEPVGEASG
jgi:excisionase family DNA binding protein